MINRRPRFLVILGLIIIWNARSEIVVLRPVADTSILAVVKDNDLGITPTLVVGANAKGLPGRALVRFNPASVVPKGATIRSVQLEFEVTKVAPDGLPSVLSAHRLLVPWAEGTGQADTGAAAKTGETTWVHRLHPSTPWATPGGLAGTDFVAASSGSTPINALGEYSLTSAGMADDVRAWLQDPSSNFGWILISDGEATAFTARRLGSREDVAHPPWLVLEYTTVVSPRILRFGRVADHFEFEFQADAGNIYEVQYRDRDAVTSPWQVLSTHVAKLVSTNVVIAQRFAESPARFYRVADVADID